MFLFLIYELSWDPVGRGLTGVGGEERAAIVTGITLAVAVLGVIFSLSNINKLLV